MRRLTILVLAAALLAAGGARAVTGETSSSSPNVRAEFDWVVYLDGVPFTSTPGQQYWAGWHFRGENGYEYWLGSNVNTPPRTPITTMIILRESLPDLAGCVYQPDPCDLKGDYYLTLYKVVNGVYTDDPLLDPAGNPYSLEQEMD